MSYRLDWEKRGVIKHFFDDVTARDMVDSVIEVESDSRFDELRYVINDFLDITGCSAGVPEIEEVSVMDRGAAATNHRIRIAVVTTHPTVIELATLYANSPINAYPTKIFATREEARAWLGLRHPRA